MPSLLSIAFVVFSQYWSPLSSISIPWKRPPMSTEIFLFSLYYIICEFTPHHKTPPQSTLGATSPCSVSLLVTDLACGLDISNSRVVASLVWLWRRSSHPLLVLSIANIVCSSINHLLDSIQPFRLSIDANWLYHSLAISFINGIHSHHARPHQSRKAE